MSDGGGREGELDRFFELSLDLLFIAGFDGYFRRVNPAVEHALGYAARELCGAPWIAFVHPDDVAATLTVGARLAEGVPVLRFENRYRKKDGTYCWLSWNTTPVAEQGVLYAVARDVTAERARAAELEAKHEQLKQAQSRLVQTEKLASLGQMVAGVAHEINNPLSFVANNLAVVQRELPAVDRLVEIGREAAPLLSTHAPELAARAREAMGDDPDHVASFVAMLPRLIDRSREGLRRIERIVQDLRNFARLDEGDPHETDLHAGVLSTVNIIRARALKKSVDLVVEAAGAPLIECQPAKVNQVVMNLIANAIDATPRGSRVVVRTAADACGGARIEVTDEGAGVPEAIRERIFDPFFTTKPPGEGVGLGLSLSYGIVEEHGGRIEVGEGEGGRGARFTVRLPARPPRR